MKEQSDQSSVKSYVGMVSVVQSMDARATLSQLQTSTVIPQFSHPGNCPYRRSFLFLKRAQFVTGENPEKAVSEECRVELDGYREPFQLEN